MPQSLQELALADIETKIKALDLNLHNREVRIRKWAWSDKQIHKGISLVWGIPVEDRGTNHRDTVGYPVKVFIIQGASNSSTGNMNTTMLARQLIWRALHHERQNFQVDCVGNIQTICSHQKIHDLPKQFRDQYDVSAMKITSWFKEPRE